LKLVLERVKPYEKTVQNPSRILINGLVLKNANLSANNYLEESNLREFEYKIPTSFLIVSKKNYKSPIEVFTY